MVRVASPHVGPGLTIGIVKNRLIVYDPIFRVPRLCLGRQALVRMLAFWWFAGPLPLFGAMLCSCLNMVVQPPLGDVVPCCGFPRLLSAFPHVAGMAWRVWLRERASFPSVSHNEQKRRNGHSLI